MNRMDVLAEGRVPDRPAALTTGSIRPHTSLDFARLDHICHLMKGHFIYARGVARWPPRTFIRDDATKGGRSSMARNRTVDTPCSSSSRTVTLVRRAV